MKSFLTIAMFGYLLPHGCHSVPTPPPPANVASAPALGAATAAQQSHAAAAVSAARHSNALNPPGPPQAATEGSLSVAAANLPAPAPADAAAELALNNAALAGKLAEAQSGWSASIATAGELSARIKTLESQVAAERVAAAAELQRQLAAVRDEATRQAEAEQRHLIGWIFFGGGALLLALAAGMVFLASSIPLVGPRAALAVGGAGALLIGTGIAINQLLSHPWLIWLGLGLVATALATAAGLMWSNHHHAQTRVPAPL